MRENIDKTIKCLPKENPFVKRIILLVSNNHAQYYLPVQSVLKVKIFTVK